MLKIIDYFVSWFQRLEGETVGTIVYCSTFERAYEVSKIALTIPDVHTITIEHRKPVTYYWDNFSYFTYWEFMENYEPVGL